MAKTNWLVTEDEISSAPPGKKLNLGDNLYLRVDKAGIRSFQLRVFVNGKDTTYSIGQYPTMTYAEARKIASARMAEVVEARRKRSLQSFREALNKKVKPHSNSRIAEKKRLRSQGRPSSSSSGFRSLEDLGKFVHSLRKAKHEIQPMLYYFLLLSVHIPNAGTKLLATRWNEFDLAGMVWRPKGKSILINSGRFERATLLSQRAKEILEELQQIRWDDDLNGNQPGTLIFPALTTFRPTAFRLALQETVHRIWPNYSIYVEDFSSLFNESATRYSYFHPDLIERVMALNPGDPAEPNFPTFTKQAGALLDWWSGTVDWFAFRNSPVPWGGTWSHERNDEGRKKWL